VPNWTDHLPWALLGLPLVAREDNNTTPAWAVFSSPPILPGQFLDSPELPSEQFLEPLSQTRSAADRPSTRHNTAAARQPPPKLPDGHVLPLQQLYDSPYTILWCSLDHFSCRSRMNIEQGVEALQHPTVPLALPRARGGPLAVCFWDLPPSAGYFLPCLM
jgi:hypothetical protein